MIKVYEAPVFEFCRINFCEDILSASDPYPTVDTDPETFATGFSDNFEESDPFDF